MGNQPTLWVRYRANNLLGAMFNEGWETKYRPATRDELLAALSQIDGAEPDIEAAARVLNEEERRYRLGWNALPSLDLAKAVVDAALAGRLVIPVGEEPK